MPWVDTKTPALGGVSQKTTFYQVTSYWRKPMCLICKKKSTDRVCMPCVSKVRRQLQDLLDFYSDAEGNLLPGRGSGRASERGLGIRLDALDYVAGFDILPSLEDWERDFRRVFGLTSFGEASAERFERNCRESPDASPHWIELKECVRFLMRWLDRAVEEYEAIDEFARELHGLWRKAQAAAGQQPRTSWRVTCPADDGDRECGQPLRISGEDFDSQISCRKCGAQWPVERLLRVVASSRHAELWLDPEAAATWFGIPSRELRRWAQAGRIKRKNNRYESHSIREAISAGSSKE